MPPYVDMRHVVIGDNLRLDHLDETPGFFWSARVGRENVMVDFHRRLREFSTPSEFFAREYIFGKEPGTLVLASGDESVHGRCFTVQDSCDEMTCITLVDARVDASKLSLLVQACVTSESTFETKMRLYQSMVGWPSSPVPQPPDLLALFKGIRGPVQPVIMDDPDIVCAATVDFGDMLVVVVNEKSAYRLFEMAGSRTNGRPRSAAPISLFVKRLLRSSGSTATRLMVSSQTTPESALEITHHESRTPDDTRGESCIVAIGVPVATFAYSIDMREDWDAIDAENAWSSDGIRWSKDRRRIADDAELSIRDVLRRPEMVESIKRRVWRPSGRLVRKMIAESG